MSLLNILILGVVQGLAELLPVSSSAHVVVTEKLLGLDPSSPPMTLLLVMLHTGTMFAVIVYFWRSWRSMYFQSRAVFRQFFTAVVIATALTGVIGEGVVLIIEHTLLRSVPHAQIEDMFGRLEYIAPALAVAGLLIIVAGLFERRSRQSAGAAREAPAGRVGTREGAVLPAAAARTGALDVALAAGEAVPAGRRRADEAVLTQASLVGGALEARAFEQSMALEPAGLARPGGVSELTARRAGIIGAVQGLSLPFRGLSRSGATISTGMLLGVSKVRAEVFSFALAVVLTPPVVAREALRLWHASSGGGHAALAGIAVRTLLGALVAFVAGLAALRWLSRWLERGRWHLFGIYCLAAALVVELLHRAGY